MGGVILASAALTPTTATELQEWRNPGFNKVVYIQSPNFAARQPEVVIDTVVLHSTAGFNLFGTVKWFLTPESEVSSHFVIGKDGSIVQQVSTFDKAWHAGLSEDKFGRTHVNDFSVGIELDNLNDGVDPYPSEQIEALKNLLHVIIRRHPIKLITSHANIARPLGRKSDPKGFPWESLRDIGIELAP